MNSKRETESQWYSAHRDNEDFSDRFVYILICVLDAISKGINRWHYFWNTSIIVITVIYILIKSLIFTQVGYANKENGGIDISLA